MVITISGTPGSGKSTIGRLLAKRLKYPYVNAGQVFRDAAAKRSMELAAFAAHVAAHPSLDAELDRALVAKARARKNLILEGRLAGWMTKRAKIPAFRLWITAREATRVDRLMEREGGTRAATLRALKKRANGERARYQKEYGIDLADTSPYDMIITTDTMTPTRIVALILSALKKTDVGTTFHGRPREDVKSSPTHSDSIGLL